jgi:hypothetical protein
MQLDSIRRNARLPVNEIEEANAGHADSFMEILLSANPYNSPRSTRSSNVSKSA